MDPSEHLRRRAEMQAKLRTPRFLDAQAAWKRIKGNFFWFERSGGMQYVRVLGHGGFGLVQLWELYNSDGSFRRSVAVKGLIRPTGENNVRAQRNEIFWSKTFSGREHMIQLVDLDPVAMQKLDINNVEDPKTDKPPDPLLGSQPPDPLMVSEYSELGSLRSLLALIDYSKQMNPLLFADEEPGIEYIPNRVLWSLFQCLVRAVVGMAYPPKDPEANKASGKTTREEIPNLGDNRKPRKIIHFDIDVGNIFLSSPDLKYRGREHYACPTAKIADYGIMAEWDDEWNEDQKASTCRYGKPAYKAPEVKDMELARQPGVICFHANVYQIGATMQELILQRTLRSDEVTAEERTVLAPSGRNWTYQTYGWRMMAPNFGELIEDYRKVDMELRAIVMACMAKKTTDRPTLEFLLRRCEERVKAFTEEAKAAAAADPRPPPAINRSEAKDRMDPEPLYIATKFYDDYFLNPLDTADEYAGYWSKPVR